MSADKGACPRPHHLLLATFAAFLAARAAVGKFDAALAAARKVVGE